MARFRETMINGYCIILTSNLQYIYLQYISYPTN